MIPPTIPLPALKRELVFDEELNAYRVRPIGPSTQRKPETGERLDGTPKPKAETPCYLCAGRSAVVHMGDSVPACAVCYDRYRRRE